MNTIRKITLMVTLTLLIWHCQKDDELVGNVNIPDNNFLEALINNDVDTNNDGQISYAEAKDVSYLHIAGEGCIDCEGSCQSRLEIKSLEGIEAFTNLTRLVITCTEIEILNLPNQSKLTVLECFSNHLKSLDISKCNALRSLNLFDNQLTAIDITYNSELEFLDCVHNQLIKLDVKHNPALKYLSFGDNQLTKIDVTANQYLEDFRCWSNNLTTVDV